MDWKNLAVGGCAVVELLPRHRKIEGCSPASTFGIGRDNGDLTFTIMKLSIVTFSMMTISIMTLAQRQTA
jgi:hypothetical protein